MKLCLTSLDAFLKFWIEEKNMDEHSSKKEESQSNDSSELSSQINVKRKSILDKWVEKFKEFLDNA